MTNRAKPAGFVTFLESIRQTIGLSGFVGGFHR